MKKIAPALLLSLGLLSTAAPAAQGPAPRVSCAEPQTQAEMNICADRDFKAADAELNAAYARLAARVEGASRARLKAAEVAWLRYRDDNCEYESAIYEGGSIRPMIHSLCLARMTKAREAELREQFNDLDN